MSMTATQLILIVLALIAMFWGLYTLYKALQKPHKAIEAPQATEIIPTVPEEKLIDGEIVNPSPDVSDLEAGAMTKDGLPILPRNQRPVVDDTFKAEITEANPNGTIVLGGENTELELSKNATITLPDDLVNVTTFKPTSDNPITVDTNVKVNEPESKDAFSLLASATETITPVVHTFDENQLKKETFAENSPILDTHIQAQEDQDQNSPLKNAVENINISIVPNEQFGRISGKDVLMLVDKYGMKYGAMNMFHRYEFKEGTGLLWFSMMSLTEDGLTPFDLNKLPNQFIKGLVLFLPLPHPKAVQGFDSMVSVANLIAHDLQATVYDETGEPLNKELTQQLRDRAINFDKNNV